MSTKQPSSIRFTEDMKGFAVPRDSTDYHECYRQGKASELRLMFHLTIEVEDVDLFVRDPRQAGTAKGYIKYSEYGDREISVEKGVFNCFVDAFLSVARKEYFVPFTL